MPINMLLVKASTMEDAEAIVFSEGIEMFQSYMRGSAPLVIGGTTDGVVDAPEY